MTQKLITKQVNSKVIDGIFYCKQCDCETYYKHAGFEDYHNYRKVCLECGWEKYE